MPFNHIDNASVTFQNIVQPASGLFPHEPAAVIGPGHNEFISRPQKVHYMISSVLILTNMNAAHHP